MSLPALSAPAPASQRLRAGASLLALAESAPAPGAARPRTTAGLPVSVPAALFETAFFSCLRCDWSWTSSWPRPWKFV